MDSAQFIVKSLRQDITEHKLQLQATIQDINACPGPLSELHILNNSGRNKISSLRTFIQKFGDVAKENRSDTLLKEVLLQREQLSSLMDAFMKANIKSMLAIEKGEKAELLAGSEEESSNVRNRHRDKEGVVRMTSSVTDQLLSISRQLADTTQRSSETLESLVTSSDSVQGTQEELKVTSGAIGQSGKLLSKYGRREFTDKILMFFAFAFFIACVLYVVQKRIF